MRFSILFFGIALFLALSVPCFSQSNQTESLTITTYYPSPYGVYGQLQTMTLGVGDNNNNSKLDSGDVPPKTSPGDVWIKGKVGIGTVTPSQALHIHSSGTWAGTRITTAATGSTINDGVNFGYDDSVGAYVWNREATPIVFSTSNTEKVRIGATGNVGIGTASPVAKLDVRGQATFLGSRLAIGDGTTMPHINTGTPGLWVSSGGSSTTSQFFGQYDSTHAGIWNQAWGPVVDIYGNVGIGRPDPAGLLHLCSPDSNNPADLILQGNTWQGYAFWFSAGKTSGGSGLLRIGGNGWTRPAQGAINVLSNYNVGIGTTDAYASLQVDGGVRAKRGDPATGGLNNGANLGYSFERDGDTGMFADGGDWASKNDIIFKTDNIERMRITSSSTYWAKTTINYDLYTGRLFVNGAVCACSDRRWKKNIQPFSEAMKKISELQGVTFNWDSERYPERGFTSDRQIGLIAQDVEKVIPEVVSADDQGYKSIDYGRLSAVLVEGVKELKAENEALKTRIELLERRLGGVKER